MACGAVQRQVDHMARLLDDLLDVSRISHGRMWLQLAPVEVNELVRTAVDMVRPQIEARQHELQVTYPDVSATVLADAVRLVQIVANLLNNAVKYTPASGRIELDVRNLDGNVTITVSDNGIGIAPAMLEKVFDMFSQVARNSGDAHGGLGIGLTLVKGLVVLHNGTVAAHSAGEGHGSQFVVTLPRAQRAPAVEGGAGVPAAARGETAPLRILVADDNIDSAVSWSEIMRDKGHEVMTVHDGMAATQAAESFRPQVALLDIGMPHLDGYEVARRIRAASWGRDMLLIAITGWGQAKDREQARAAGFDEHFTKPLDPDDLVHALGDASGRRAMAGNDARESPDR
jgi:CheY-like chemotaxis protein/two-component sensor histidine kinase